MSSPGDPPIRLRLFVAGTAPNSIRALHNARALHDRLAGREVELEIVDVFVEPSRALDEGVLLTPMLVLVVEAGQSGTARQVVGSLEDHDAVLAALGLAGPP